MMRYLTTFSMGALALLLATRGAAAQTAAEPEPGSELNVYALTFGPGDDPWEKWGHNALRIQDPYASHPADRDRTYNWGMFPDFTSTFVWKFLQGRLMYSMGSASSGAVLEGYAAAHRSIFQQKLNLTPRQKRDLRDKLRLMDAAADKTYLYNYYNNNCSTKVRDIIDDASKPNPDSPGVLSRITVNVPAAGGVTYRFHTDRLDAGDLWLYVALQAVMGHAVDRPIDRWQEMFLPQKLHDRISDATVVIDGKQAPFVIEERIFDSKRPPDPQRPPVMAPWFLLVGVACGAIFAVLGYFARRHWTARWGFVLLTTPWLLLMGLGATVMWWGWLVTDHDVARRNENVMHVSVLALLLLIMLPRLAFGKKRGAKFTVYLTCAMVAISVLGLLLKEIPWFGQVNWPIIALCLPVNAALAYAAWKMAQAPAVVVKAPEGSGRKTKKSR